MIEVKVDKSRLKAMAAGLPEYNRKAAQSVLKSISYQCNTMLKAYARTRRQWAYAPITPLFRKGAGYGSWFAKYSQYGVDPAQLQAKFGMLGAADVQGMERGKLKPLSKGFVTGAKRLASGYKMKQTFKRQRWQAKNLMQRMGSVKKVSRAVVKTWKSTGGSWHGLIPRVGWHTVRARPIVEPFLPTIRTFAIANMKRLYQQKMQTGKYPRDWYL
jgi:hypothetical protein